MHPSGHGLSATNRTRRETDEKPTETAVRLKGKEQGTTPELEQRRQRWQWTAATGRPVPAADDP